MSAADVAQPETLIRMAGRLLPAGRAAPAGPVLLNGLDQGQRPVIGGRPDQHLVEHDVVQHLQASRPQPGGHGLGVLAGAHDQIGHALPA